MEKFIYCREEYNDLINEGLLTGSFDNPKMSEKDSELGGYNLAKIKNFAKVRSIKKLLDNYVKTAEDLMIKEYESLSDEQKKSYAGPLITMQNDDEGENDEENAAEQEADEEKRRQKIAAEKQNPKGSKTITSSLRLSDASKKLLDKMVKNIEQTISSVKDDQIKEWAKMMFTNAEVVIAQDFLEHVKGENKEDLEKKLNDTESEQKKQEEKLSKEAKKEEEKKKEEQRKEDKEEIKASEFDPEKESPDDIMNGLKEASEDVDKVETQPRLKAAKQIVEECGGEINNDTLKSVAKTCHDVLSSEIVKLENEKDNMYIGCYYWSVIEFQALCCTTSEVIDKFIADDDKFTPLVKIALTDGGYQETLANAFQTAITKIQKNPVFTGGTNDEIKEQGKLYKSNVRKLSKAIYKKAQDIADKLKKEQGQ